MQRWGASWSLLIQFYQLNPTLPTPPSRWLIQTCRISASFLAGIEKPSMVSGHPWWDSVWLMGRGNGICSPKTQHRW